MKQWLYKFIFFRIMGWQIVGTINPEIKKCVMMVMPHTSWHDFYLGGFTRGIIKIPMHYIAKKELFKFPFGYYFRWMGGKPLDRTGSANKVEAVAKLFDNYNELRLAIMPEGTRKKVSELKTGFYYIAEKAKVPIIPVAFDFSRKKVCIGDPLKVSGDFANDMKILYPFFDGAIGKIPEFSFKFS